MADLLATPEDLRALPNPALAALTDNEATLALEMATGAVQAATGGQELVLRTDDSAEFMGTADVWLDLKQRPVTAVSAVSIDGAVVTDFKRFGARLWRRRGWATCAYEPSLVAVTYTHGFPPGDQRLQYARGIALALAAQIGSDPTGKLTGMSIDDYREQYAQGGGEALAGVIPETVQKTLRRMYGPRGQLTRIG
jgi:hypothetical protein